MKNRIALACVAVALSWAGHAAAQQDVSARHQRLADVLQQGERASQGHGKRDAAALAAAARALARMGAQPADGTADLVKQWSEQAVRMGYRKAQDTAFRGRVLGPAYRKVRLDPASEDISYATFLAGQPATVTITAQSGSKVSFAVESPDKTNPCTVTFAKSRQHCAWMPIYTQRYTIRLQSKEAVTDAFVIIN